jgi:hypothetical protein
MFGAIRTIQIPGGSQALERTEAIDIHIDGLSVRVNRPTLLGAVLIKARSILVHDDPESQRADLVLLLSLIEDPSQTARELQGKERSWLRKCDTLLAVDDPVRMASFPPERVRRARLAYGLLVA